MTEGGPLGRHDGARKEGGDAEREPNGGGPIGPWPPDVDPAGRRSPEHRGDEREADEGRERAGAIGPQLGADVHDRVVERPAEESDERIVREDHRRAPEAEDAHHDSGEGRREPEEHAKKPPPSSPARDFGGDGAPRSPHEGARSGGEPEEDGGAPEVADAHPKTVQERGGERDGGEPGAVRDPPADARDGGGAFDGREREGGGDRGRGGDDEAARERLLVAGPPEEREKPDRRQDREDDGGADAQRARDSPQSWASCSPSDGAGGGGAIGGSSTSGST